MRLSLYLALPLALWLAVVPSASRGQQTPPRPVKNVILLISDGTSLATISLARWYQRYLNPTKTKLAIDPYMSGTVITYCSNAPTGDSAPTTSCYMTGVPSLTGYISTYPPDCGKNNLVPLDSTRAYAPLLTLMEAARLEQGKRIGLAVTCQFPHATPADCAAHYHQRKAYDVLAQQMVHNHLDVVIGGGTDYITPAQREWLAAQGCPVHIDNLAALRAETNHRFWALFGKRDLPYDIDRDTSSYPSLAESTRLAIRHLNEGPNGFFLMVEGSKVDWAAHDNDPVALPTEFLAFDEACRVALDFARRDGQTAVLITADHGNSGISIGKESWPRYDEYSADELFGQLARFRTSAEALAKQVNQTAPTKLDSLFELHCGFSLSEAERQRIYACKGYRQSPLPVPERKERDSLSYSTPLRRIVSRIFSDHTPIAFATHGHTAEEVFMASYHPENDRAMGVITNIEFHQYMASLLGFKDGIDHLNAKYFVPHTEVFRNQRYTIEPSKEGEAPTLVVRSTNKRHTLRAIPHTSVVHIDGKPKDIGSLVVYSPESKLFYLPASLRLPNP